MICKNVVASLPTWGSLLVAAIVIQLVIFVYQVTRFHRTHRSYGNGKVLPNYPFLIPYVGAIIPLLWDARGTVTRLTHYDGKPTIARVPIFPGINIFLYQDPEIIRRIWKVSASLDFRPLAVHFFRKACGMSQEAANLYLNDETGNYAKPVPGTNCPEDLRVYRKIYESDRRALIGPGLEPTLQRFINAFSRRMSAFMSEEWIEVEDFWTLIQNTVGAAEIEAIFGPKLLEMHPDFIRLFFEFDLLVPSFLKMLSFGRAERIRYKLHSKFRLWLRRTRETYTKASKSDDSDGGDDDRHWGSHWTRYRHMDFQHFFDDDALASHDVGVAWGALGNTTPCAMMAIIHTFKDVSLHKRLREDLDELCKGKHFEDIYHKEFTSHTLLSAIYAETLRLHVTAFVPVIPLHGELDLGKWRIPQASWGFINAGVAHHNKDVWNTKAGLHPVESFWADRFIVDPADALSGPIRHGSWDHRGLSHHEDDDDVNFRGPHFSLEGLDGSWIPFGGGRNMCPGRFLAKGVIAVALAMMVRRFDLEILTDEIPTGKDRFGIGVELPTCKIPFRIRKRKRPTVSLNDASLTSCSF